MKTIALLALFLLGGPLFSQDKSQPRPEDFAGALNIAGTAGSLMVLEIPEQVYSGLERPDMGDLRVFDPSGVPVPFVVRSPPRQIVTPPPEPAPFFIWRPAGEKSLPSNRDIEIDTAGGVVRIRDSHEAAGNQPVYLVDLSGLSQPPSALRITIAHNGVFFNGAVAIHTSADLNQWQAFSKRQTVSYYGESGANRNQLEIPAGFRYALLDFDQRIPPLRSVEAVFDPQAVSTEIRETRVSGKKSDDGTFVYYDTKGYYPLTAIDFRFQEPDSMQVYIRNRLNRSDEWYEFETQWRIYRFYSGASLRTNKPFTDFRASSAGRYWELEAVGELSFGSIPECYVIWEPLQLVFLARGTGPWTLAYGNSDYFPAIDGLTLSPEDTLVAAMLTGDGRYTPRQARPAESRRAWSQWILWGTLLLAAGVLTVLAFRIARSMRG